LPRLHVVDFVEEAGGVEGLKEIVNTGVAVAAMAVSAVVVNDVSQLNPRNMGSLVGIVDRANHAHPMTWCCILKLCIHSGEEQ
jgi:hypothetical protein